ncbi:MAG: HAD superfamily hydrolase (TIGR01509 family) [Limisphaerales bacterium]|jgi:HAD superfamily hydrolase (TIGR01509 family)
MTDVTAGEYNLKTRFSAIIFDMDGVIVDSEPLHVQAFLDIFAELGLGDSHGIDFSAYLGKSDRSLWVDFLKMHQPSHSLEELQAWKQGHTIEMLRRKKPIFPPVPELVSRLAEKHPLAVASGSLHAVIDAVLELDDLRRHFDTIVSVQDVTRTKPAPDIFLHTAELLAVPPAEICVIEDSAAGVQAALSAGMQVIAITNSLPASELSQANAVVDNYEQISQLLLK